MHCWECSYTNKVKRKHGITTHCNLEPTGMDVTYNISHKVKNTLCPFICSGTRYSGVNYGKYTDK